MKEKPSHTVNSSMHGPCEYPTHVDGCSGVGNTKDHLTPQSIGRELGWTKEEIDDPMNTQWLSPACHTDKDRSTPLRLQQVKLQEQGVVVDFGQHVTFGTKREAATRNLIKQLQEKEIFRAPKRRVA